MDSGLTRRDVLRLGGYGLGAAAVAGLAVWSPETGRVFPKRTPVRFWHRWGGQWEEKVRLIVHDFNASQDDFEVIPLSTPSAGADAKFLLAAVGGDPPDVMSIWNGAIPAFAAAQLLTPLESLMSREDAARFARGYPAVRDSGKFRGETYGVTIGADLYAFYCRADQIRAQGLDPAAFPTSLEGVQAWGAKLHRFDGAGNLQRLGCLISGFSYLAPHFGGGFWDPDAERVLLNTPENLRCLEFIVDDRKRIGYDKVVRFYSGLDTAASSGGWPFIGGSLSITFDGQWRVEEISRFKPDLDYFTAPLPPPEGGVPLAGTISGNYMIIPRSARHQEGAWEFVKYWSGLGDVEAGGLSFTRGGWLPLSPDVAASQAYSGWLEKNPQFKTFLKILESPNCRTYPGVPYLQFLLDEIGRTEDAAVRGAMTPQEALVRLERNVAEELEKRRRLGYRD